MKNSFHWPRTRVKICGFTCPEQARDAACLGVDAVGLVFYGPSSRCVDLAQARAIVDVLPAFVTTVALFVDPRPDEVRQVVETVPVDLLQFHGDEDPGFCETFGTPYIKAVRMSDDVDLGAISQAYAASRGLLLDAYHPDDKGGTGLSFDWNRVPKDMSLPLILAGGLNSDNVRQAIALTRPYAVDVSSGVESARGVKDRDRMAAFIKEVQGLEHAN